jgi:hypothetical protein
VGDFGTTLTNLRPTVQKLGEDLGKIAAALGEVTGWYTEISGWFTETLDDWGKWGEAVRGVAGFFQAAFQPVQQVYQLFKAIYDLFSGNDVTLPSWLTSIGNLFGGNIPETFPGTRTQAEALAGKAMSGAGRGANPNPTAANTNPYSRPFTEDTRPAPAAASRAGRSISVTVNTGVGDPVEIAKGVRRVLELERRRTG